MQTLKDMLSPQMMQQPMPQAAPQQPPGPPPELEAMRPQRRDTWRDVLGSIFDAMSAFGGGEANYWNRVNDDRTQFEDLQRQYALTKQRIDAAAQQREADRLSRLAEPTGTIRTLQQLQAMPPAERENLIRLQNQMHPPQFVPDGFGGGQYVTPGDTSGGLPPGYDPNEWEVVPGGASQDGSRPF